MKCPMCDNGKFELISLVTNDTIYEFSDYDQYHSLMLARANITEFPKGNFEIYEVEEEIHGEKYTRWKTKEGEYLPRKHKHGMKPGEANWVITTKACVSCGYIAMFLPLEELRNKKEKDAIAAEKKKQEEAAAKKKKQEEAAAKKKKRVQAEKEKLKKRLAELEDED